MTDIQANWDRFQNLIGMLGSEKKQPTRQAGGLFQNLIGMLV